LIFSLSGALGVTTMSALLGDDPAAGTARVWEVPAGDVLGLIPPPAPDLGWGNEDGPLVVVELDPAPDLVPIHGAAGLAGLRERRREELVWPAATSSKI